MLTSTYPLEGDPLMGSFFPLSFFRFICPRILSSFGPLGIVSLSGGYSRKDKVHDTHRSFFPRVTFSGCGLEPSVLLHFRLCLVFFALFVASADRLPKVSTSRQEML